VGVKQPNRREALNPERKCFMAGNSDAVPFGEGSSVVSDENRAPSKSLMDENTDLDGEKSEKEGEGEAPAEPKDAKADDGKADKDGDKKHETHVPYERFKEVNEKASQHELKSKAFDDLMTTKAGRELISKMVAGTYTEEDGKEPEIPSLEGLNFAEMEDSKIGELLAGHATAKVMASLKKELGPIKQFMQSVQQRFGQSERDALFAADKGRDYPLAVENRKQIEGFLDKGLDFDAAYWAACGKTAAQAKFDEGRTKKEEKQARETHVAPRGKTASGQQRTGRPYKSIQAAWNESKQELGI
jgi:hypothetical protein